MKNGFERVTLTRQQHDEMEFFINHTQKQIEFAGEDAHLNKFLGKLRELVEVKNWSLDDDIEMYIHSVDPEYSVQVCVEKNGYHLDEEYWYLFFPDESERMISESYDREMAHDIKTEDDTTWSGWDTVGATCDV